MLLLLPQVLARYLEQSFQQRPSGICEDQAPLSLYPGYPPQLLLDSVVKLHQCIEHHLRIIRFPIPGQLSSLTMTENLRDHRVLDQVVLELGSYRVPEAVEDPLRIISNVATIECLIIAAESRPPAIPP